MKLHPSAHKHVGDSGKPGQIVNPAAPPSQAQLVRDLMYKHRISPFTGKQVTAKTLKDTL